MDGEEYDYMAANVVEHDERGGLAFRAVNTLNRVGCEDEEWIRMTGYYDQKIATAGTWATMDVYRALDPDSAKYMYLFRWEDGLRVVPYLVENQFDLAELVGKLKVLGEGLKKPE